ncbi:MAG: hypothetical protein M5F18_03215 [Asgard group archaeon]|nr:hypothetical protein [Asgard group archaeon]
MKFTSIFVAAAIAGTSQACILPLLNCFTGKSGSSWGNWGWGGSTGGSTNTQPCVTQAPPQPCETVVAPPPCVTPTPAPCN